MMMYPFTSSYAATNTLSGTLELINKSDQTIYFKIEDGAQYAPGLHGIFSLQKNKEITTTILPKPNFCSTFPTANPYVYIQGNGLTSSGVSDVFFGTGLACAAKNLPTRRVEVSGFLDKNLAYSWQVQGATKTTIAFCNPADYPCN